MPTGIRVQGVAVVANLPARQALVRVDRVLPEGINPVLKGRRVPVAPDGQVVRLVRAGGLKALVLPRGRPGVTMRPPWAPTSQEESSIVSLAKVVRADQAVLPVKGALQSKADVVLASPAAAVPSLLKVPERGAQRLKGMTGSRAAPQRTSHG